MVFIPMMFLTQWFQRATRAVWPGGRLMMTLLAVALLGGCATTSSGGGGGGGIEEIHLFGLPVALSFESSGPAGFAVRVYASSHSRAHGVVVRKGTLDILMYDGGWEDGSAATKKPLRVWSFPAAQLPPYETTSALGIGYQFALRWEGNRPTQSRLTVLARFTPAGGGAPLYSAPSVLPVATK